MHQLPKFETIFKLFETLQSRACKAKMPYVNLTLDVGAFINAYSCMQLSREVFKRSATSWRFSLYEGVIGSDQKISKWFWF